MAKQKPEQPEGPFVVLKHFVLVRMPFEAGKSADRYAVVKVNAKAYVAEGEVIEDGLQLVYAKKRISLELTREADHLRRSIEVVA